MSIAELYLTDGTPAGRIDLQGTGRTGWRVDDWQPGVGRDVTERISLMGLAFTPDDMIRYRADLEQLLTKATEYYDHFFQSTPIYLACRAKCETNMRYALIREGRMPKDVNPFGMPFIGQPFGYSALQGLTLELRRLDWMAHPPGESQCVETSGQMQLSHPAYIEFNATTTDIDCLSAPAIDNLPAGANGFTAEAWVRANGWGENNFGMILNKRNAASGWFIGIANTAGFYTHFDCAATTVSAWSGVDEFSVDSDWHHVAVTYDDATKVARLWIDGVEPTSYLQHITGAGAYGGDAAQNLHIGNRTALNRTWDGDIGWTRISNTIRYVADFTPPPRCTMPAVDANTVTQHIGPELGGATIDNAGSAGAAADGTLANGVFHCDCYEGDTFGQEATCEKDVYVANKHVRAQLSHIFPWSAANGFGLNRIGMAPPFDLVDVAGAAPAINDFVYFGIQTDIGGFTVANSGPFSSLVLDISRVLVDITIDDWEYSAAWNNLTTLQDNTWDGGAMTAGAGSFDTIGVNSIHWEQPSNWTTAVVNGVTGYWVRARITAVGAAPVAPQQDNRDVYTITQPYIEVAAVQVGGDLDALMKLDCEPRSFRQNYNEMHSNVFILGARDCVRGEDFSAYLNWAYEQNPTGVSVEEVGAFSSIAARVEAATGWALYYNPAGVQPLVDAAHIHIEEGIAGQFAGTYHVFLRGELDGAGPAGTEDTIRATLRLSIGEDVGGQYLDLFQTEPQSFISDRSYSMMDMGQMTIPRFDVPIEDLRFTISLEKQAVLGWTAWFYDVILIPTDEWVGEYDASNYDPLSIIAGNQFVVDALSDLRESKGTITKASRHPGREHVIARCRETLTSAPVLLANKKSRIWTFVYSSVYARCHYVGSRTQVDNNQRYKSMRGAR